MSQVKNTYESKVNELTKRVEIKVFVSTCLLVLSSSKSSKLLEWSSEWPKISSEKESMMEYVYQYDNLQRQLQLLQWVSQPLKTRWRGGDSKIVQNLNFEVRRSPLFSNSELIVPKKCEKAHKFFLLFIREKSRLAPSQWKNSFYWEPFHPKITSK